MQTRPLALLVLALLWPVAAGAQSASLFAASGGLTGPAADPAVTRRGPSLFAGTSPSGLFAPWPERRERTEPAVTTPPLMRQGGTRVARLFDLIAAVEAGAAGYDAVQHGARIRPAKPPTRLRIGEIRAWVAATPGQQHAIGRYQFIPDTFDHLVARLGLPDDTLFSPEVQDRMAERLLLDAGLRPFLRGETGRTAFMNRLARIWAGLPNSSGRSHYHGLAGNRAAISWAAFEREMKRIFPAAPA